MTIKIARNYFFVAKECFDWYQVFSNENVYNITIPSSMKNFKQWYNDN